MDNKDFYGWIKLKMRLHFMRHFCVIKDGDIWWCAVGENGGCAKKRFKKGKIWLN